MYRATAGPPTSSAPYSPQAGGPSNSTNNEQDSSQKKMFRTASLIINMGLSFMVAANGAIAIGKSNDASDAGTVFVGLYMILFAAILFLYEAIQMHPIDSVDLVFKKNFGFLYGHIGKACYLLFVYFFVYFFVIAV